MRRKWWIMLLLAVVAFFGCQRRPMEYLASTGLKVIVKIIWKVDVYPDGVKPTGITLYFFRDGEFYMQHTTSNVDSCAVQLDPGHYQLYMITQSPEEYGKLEFEHMTDFNAAEVSVVNTKSSWYKSKAGEEEVIDNPEMMAAGVAAPFDVTQEMVEEYQRYAYSLQKLRKELSNKTKTKADDDDLTEAEEMVNYYTIRVPINPTSIVSQYWVTIYAQNADVLKSVRASTTGMAKSFEITKNVTGDAEGTQLITQWSLTMDDEPFRIGHVDGKITTFGLPSNETPSAIRDSTLNVSALLIDDKTVADYVFNVGDKIKLEEAPKGYRALYRLIFGSKDKPAIDLPDVKPPDSGGGGFTAAVTDWDDEINVDIPI